MEAEDEDAGLDLLSGEQFEAAGLLSEVHLGSGGGEGYGGEGVAEGGVAGLVEGGEPAVEEVAGGGVGDEAGFGAVAGQADEDGGVDRADVVSLAGWDGASAGSPRTMVSVWEGSSSSLPGGARCGGGGGTGGSGIAWYSVMAGVFHGEEDQGHGGSGGKDG